MIISGKDGFIWLLREFHNIDEYLESDYYPHDFGILS